MALEFTAAEVPPFAPAANQLRKGALGVGAVTFFLISASPT